MVKKIFILKKLKRESLYEGLTSKELEQQKLNQMFKEVSGLKKVRKFIKDRQKKRRFYEYSN